VLKKALLSGYDPTSPPCSPDKSHNDIAIFRILFRVMHTDCLEPMATDIVPFQEFEDALGALRHEAWCRVLLTLA
jgi:hypothetical protein